MTLQQLQYIIMLEKYRSFAKAAEVCDITQPTISKMIANLEDELDVKLFERSSKKVFPTDLGNRIISQARKVVMESERILEIIKETKDSVSGKLKLSIGPSISPYILPAFIRHYVDSFPEVSLSIEEMRPDSMIQSLLLGTIDAGIALGGNKHDGIFEIPLYSESFYVYIADTCSHNSSSFTPDQLNNKNMWVMKEVQCLRESTFSFCKARETGRRVYEAGNIDTLIRVVDENGGFTIIPEMHLNFLTEKQKMNVRKLEGNSRSGRKISMYIRQDYVREKMLNTISSTLIKCIPEKMIEPSLMRFGIRL